MPPARPPDINTHRSVVYDKQHIQVIEVLGVKHVFVIPAMLVNSCSAIALPPKALNTASFLRVYVLVRERLDEGDVI